MTLKTLLRILGVALLVICLVGVNGGIYFSSVPHQEQMGWAEFVAINGLILGALGFISLMVAESSEIAIRQLDIDRKRERTPA